MKNTDTKTIRLIGVPMDLGAGRRGVDMGPSAIRIAGVSNELRRLGFGVEDDGDVGHGCRPRRSFRIGAVVIVDALGA